MMIMKKGISLLVPEGLPEHLTAFTTTRHGGFSKAPYDSLNFGYFVGDATESVIKNTTLLAERFGVSPLVTLRQVHGAHIVRITDSNASEMMFTDGDGLFTDVPGVALGVLTADCYTVMLTGERCIANLHCGWRSINGGIIENAMAMFRQEQDTVTHAVVGPGICETCYEVGPDMIQQLRTELNPQNALTVSGGKVRLSLRTLIEAAIVNGGGVSTVLHMKHCPSCDPYLFSYRRENGVTGRMVSVLMRNV